MRRLALLSVPLTLLILSLGGGLSSQATEPTPSPTPASPATPDPSPAPSDEPALSPTPVSSADPTPPVVPSAVPGYTGKLKAGDWVQITGTDSCLNARTQAGTTLPYPDGDPNATILNCLPDGFIGLLAPAGGAYGPTQAPVQADGHWWWYMVGQGWVAEEWLAFHHEGSPFWPPRPDLAGSGLIAYIGRDNNVWLMNADGTDQRLLAAGSGPNGYVEHLVWSPTGQQVSFSVSNWQTAEAPYSVSTRIVDITGALVAELPGLTAVSWSPDGGRISAIRVDQPRDLGGAHGTPLVRDLVSGAEIGIGPPNWYGPAPAWSPHGTSLAFFCSSGFSSTLQPDGSVLDVTTDCGAPDGLRIVAADGSQTRVILPPSRDSGIGYGAFSWSPAGDVIAVSSYPNEGTDGCRGYVLVDTQTGAAGACFPFPPAGGFGGCGFSSETGASDWSPDGRYLLHHGQFGGGNNGVWIVEVASGEKTMIPVNPVASIDVAPGGQQLAFAGAGNIWVADIDGANPAPIAEGASPVWQPSQ